MRIAVMMIFASLLMACEVNEKLAGTRISVFDLQQKLRAARPDQAEAIILPKPRLNSAWAQMGGDAPHHLQHLAFGKGALRELWRVPMGERGDLPVQSPPIASQGRVFVLDGEARLHAFALGTGKALWQRRLTDEPLGGAIAYAAGRIFVATGAGRAAAVNARSGDILWSRELGIPFRAAPIVDRGQVYLMDFNNRLSVRDTLSGQELWSHQGVGASSSLFMPLAVAVAQQQVVVPYHSGGIYALRASDRTLIWTDNLQRQGLTNASAQIGFVAVPAIAQGRVYLVGSAGYMVALRLRDGQRLWSQNISGVNMPWVAGRQVYLAADNGSVLCLSSRQGLVLWGRSLPMTPQAIWYGPILAGSALWLTSSDGRLAKLSPKDGKVLMLRQLATGFLAAPIIVDQTMLLLSDDMELIALRAASL